MKLSIIVPVYKAEKYISRCVDSILAQTFKDFELILIDDGSPDNSGNICDEYAEKDNRIKVIHQQNKGCSAARNAGIKQAQGEYIGFVDSDDWINSLMYEKLLEILEKYDADIVKSGFDLTDGKDSHSYELFDKSLTVEEENILDYYYMGAKGSVIWNAVYKAEIVKKVIFPVGCRYEDVYASYMYLALAKRAVFVRDCYYNYFDNPEAFTRAGNGQKEHDDRLAVVKKIVNDVEGKDIVSHKEKERLKNLYARAFYHYIRDSKTVHEISCEEFKNTVHYLDLRRSLRFRYVVWKNKIKVSGK